jgi:hypothetical protein
MSNGALETVVKVKAEPENALAIPDEPMGLTSRGGFELMQRVAKCLGASTLVPKDFQGPNNLPNVVIALEMANRIGVTPLAVIQNLYIVHGKPGWSSTFIIASVNSCGRYCPLRFDMQGQPDSDARTCVAWTTEVAFPLPRGAQTLALARESGLPVLEGPPVSILMAKKEGWYTKNGSKWQTMPELMLRYRAATFFGRLFAPDLLMGIRPTDELEDITGMAVGDVIPARLPRRVEAVDAAPPPPVAEVAEAPAEPAPADADLPPDPAAQSPAQSPAARPDEEGSVDRVAELRQLIEDAGDSMTLSPIHAQMEAAREWIGEAAYAELETLYGAQMKRFLQFSGKGRGRK